MELLRVERRLTPADHQTHRRYAFEVPAECTALHVEVRYQPKYLPLDESRSWVQQAIASQSAALADDLGNGQLVDAWARAFATSTAQRRVANLITPSLDDASGAYRGAGHRQSPDQRIELRPASASPGFTQGQLPTGTWHLTLSVHTLVSAACAVSIQIGAETASSEPSAARSSA